MLISSLSRYIRVLNTNLPQGVVSVREAGIRHYLCHDRFQSNAIYLFLLPTLFAAIFVPFATATATLLPPTSSLSFLLLLLLLLFRGWRRLFYLFLSSHDSWFDDLLDLLTISRDRVKCKVGCVAERVLLFDGNSRVFLELMRTQQAQNSISVVGQDHVTRGVKLDENVVGSLASTEGQVNDTIHPQLSDVLDLFRTQMLS